MIWAAVHMRFPQYVIYDDGAVVSHVLRNPRRLSPIKMGEYVGLQLRNAQGQTEKIYLHRLVTETFHGAPPPGHEVRHLDGIRKHNSADNLRWGTRSENARDRDLHGTSTLGERHPAAKLKEKDILEIRRLAAAGASPGLVMRRFGISRMNHWRIVNRQLWRHVDG